MARIQLNESLGSMIMKMVEGNPGAVLVCMQLIDESDKIDPDSMMGGIGQIMFLDTLGIYGSRIWMLYKDMCKENIATTIAILRAVQLGFLSESKLNHAINNWGDGVDLDSFVAQVQERLPNFRKEE